MFGIYKMLPGDPVRMMIGDTSNIQPERYETMYAQYEQLLGLDKPLPVQYVVWITNMLKGDFGYSVQYRRPVVQIISVPMRNTIMLNLISMALVFLISVPLGIATAVKKNTFFDRAIQVLTNSGYSLPSFVIALCLPFTCSSIKLG